MFVICIVQQILGPGSTMHACGHASSPLSFMPCHKCMDTGSYGTRPPDNLMQLRSSWKDNTISFPVNKPVLTVWGACALF